MKENVGKKREGRKPGDITGTHGFGECRRALGAQTPALCLLTNAARTEYKCSCARPDSWAREGDHLQTKLFQFNNHSTAQSCRKERGQGSQVPAVQIPTWPSPLRSRRAHLLWSPRRPVCSPHVDSCVPRGRLGLAGVSREPHKGTAGLVTLRGPRDSQYELLEPAAQRPSTVRVPGPQRRGAG